MQKEAKSLALIKYVLFYICHLFYYKGKNEM